MLSALAQLLAMRPMLLVADKPCFSLDMPVQADTMWLLITYDTAAAQAVDEAFVGLEPMSPAGGPSSRLPA